MKIDAETMKKQVILHLPYVLFLLVFAKLGEAVRLAPGADASQKLLGLSEGFALAFQSMWPGAAMDWLIGLCGAAIMRLAVYLRGKDAKKYRKNVEYGSARWGNKADIAPFMDPKPENNIILTQSEGLMLNGRPKNPANARNKNVLVVGGSGSGKTRFFIKPNLMQMHSSYVVTDPKGTVLVECGKMLQRGTPKLDKDGKPVRNEKGKIIYEPYKIRVSVYVGTVHRDLCHCIWPYDRDLFNREPCTDPVFHNGKPGMGTNGNRVSAFPFCPGFSGFFDSDLCCHLCSAGPVYPIVRRRARRDLGNGGLYGTAGLCPV